jgi:pantoate kinase
LVVITYITFKKVSFGSETFSKTAVLALKSPTSAHFMSFSMRFANSFSISQNASIEEYREFSGRMYTHPNKRSLLNTCEMFSYGA